MCINEGLSEAAVKREMIDYVEERFGEIEYEVVRFEPVGLLKDSATLYAHVPGIEGAAGDFWVTRYVVDGVYVVREGYEVGDVVIENSYYRVLVHDEFEEYAQSMASEVFPECKVSVDIRGYFSGDVVAATSMAEAFEISPEIRCSVIVFVEGEYSTAEEFLEATRPLLDNWIDAGVAPRTGMRCFLMKPGEYDSVDMTKPMRILDSETYLYDVSISTKQQLVELVSDQSIG